MIIATAVDKHVQQLFDVVRRLHSELSDALRARLDQGRKEES